ncbi:Protein of unknown function [Gryllus bimaculatus]|nr:Protein of unknown function [Gryllus bimaculatus]
MRPAHRGFPRLGTERPFGKLKVLRGGAARHSGGEVVALGRLNIPRSPSAARVDAARDSLRPAPRGGLPRSPHLHDGESSIALNITLNVVCVSEDISAGMLTKNFVRSHNKLNLSSSQLGTIGIPTGLVDLSPDLAVVQEGSLCLAGTSLLARTLLVVPLARALPAWSLPARVFGADIWAALLGSVAAYALAWRVVAGESLAASAACVLLTSAVVTASVYQGDASDLLAAAAPGLLAARALGLATVRVRAGRFQYCAASAAHAAALALATTAAIAYITFCENQQISFWINGEWHGVNNQL